VSEMVTALGVAEESLEIAVLVADKAASPIVYRLRYFYSSGNTNLCC